jgi:hypothetical protein
VGGLAHYARCKPGVLDIFSEYSLKIPQICLNILKYTRTFPCRAGGQVGRWPVWAGRQTNNPAIWNTDWKLAEP